MFYEVFCFTAEYYIYPQVECKWQIVCRITCVMSGRPVPFMSTSLVPALPYTITRTRSRHDKCTQVLRTERIALPWANFEFQNAFAMHAPQLGCEKLNNYDCPVPHDARGRIVGPVFNHPTAYTIVGPHPVRGTLELETLTRNCTRD